MLLCGINNTMNLLTYKDKELLDRLRDLTGPALEADVAQADFYKLGILIENIRCSLSQVRILEKKKNLFQDICEMSAKDFISFVCTLLIGINQALNLRRRRENGQNCV
jgi:hypothetical protein